MWVLWGHCALTRVCSPSRILRMFSAPVTRTTGRPRRCVLKTFPYLSRRELWKREPWGRAAGQPVVPGGLLPTPPRPPAPYLEQPVQSLPEEGPAHGALGQGQGAGAVPAEAPAQRPQVPAQGDEQSQGQQHQRRRLGPGEPGRHPPSAAGTGREAAAVRHGGRRPATRLRALRDGPCRLLPARPRSPPAAGSPLGHIYIDIGHLRPIHLRR